MGSQYDHLATQTDHTHNHQSANECGMCERCKLPQVWNYASGRTIFDEMNSRHAKHVTREEFVIFVTEKWAWLDKSSANTAFYHLTDGGDRLTRKAYFKKILKVHGCSELDKFLKLIQCDLATTQTPAGSKWHQMYEAK